MGWNDNGEIRHVANTSNAIDTQTMTSLPGMFFSQADRLDDRPFLWAKIDGVYRSRTWNAVREHVIAVAHGLKAAGVKPGDRVMLVAENRPEWFIADMAIMTAGAIAVPTYTTNTALNHLHILNDSGSTVAIVSTPECPRTSQLCPGPTSWLPVRGRPNRQRK